MIDTSWNPKNMATLDAWRINLSRRLAELLPPDTVVELLAVRDPDSNKVCRYIVIHCERDLVKIELKFPESLDVVMARVLEAIK